MSRLHKVDAKKFRELKAALKTGAKKSTIANRNGVSVETLRKVKNAKNFLEYQAYNVKSNIPPTPGTVVRTVKVTVNPVKVKDNRKWWEKLLNI